MKAGTSLPMRDKLLNKIVVNETTGCWVWAGSVDKDGYGRMRGSVCNKVWSKKAHRASYEEFVGPIPEDKQVLHSCDNPSCINPEHLHLGDPALNNKEKWERGRGVAFGKRQMEEF